jgi:hypothetical protein
MEIVQLLPLKHYTCALWIILLYWKGLLYKIQAGKEAVIQYGRKCNVYCKGKCVVRNPCLCWELNCSVWGILSLSTSRINCRVRVSDCVYVLSRSEGKYTCLLQVTWSSILWTLFSIRISGEWTWVRWLLWINKGLPRRIKVKHSLIKYRRRFVQRKELRKVCRFATMTCYWGVTYFLFSPFYRLH